MNVPFPHAPPASFRARTPVLLASAVLLLLLGGLATAPGEARAQSLLSAGGLGTPVDATDARSRALGGASVGLTGAGVFPSDPASAAAVSLPGIAATMEANVTSPEDGVESGGTRFPSLAILFPTRGYVFTGTLVGVLSQEWNAAVVRDIDLGDASVQARDSFEGRGGVSAARFGVARPIGESLQVGAAFGTYIGSMERQFIRELSPADVGPGVEPFGVRGVWRARGLNGVVGANWRLDDLLRVGATLVVGGDLELNPTGETDASTQTIPMPTELRLGASGLLLPGLTVAVETSRADWSDAGRALGNEGGPGVAWSFGGGAEWNRITILGRPLPVAAGYRQRDLPFSFLGESATERAFTAGVGAHLVDATESTPLGRIHLSLETGTRSTDSWDENFLRTTLSLRVSGR
ncbi:MAG: hypothetical protein EA352_07480 [Gemmatimonadales bacterium]|nr:MAG: hypothetical protein EA352_07480 [Gemmatimonadales bacterium]